MIPTARSMTSTGLVRPGSARGLAGAENSLHTEVVLRVRSSRLKSSYIYGEDRSIRSSLREDHAITTQSKGESRGKRRMLPWRIKDKELNQ